MAIQKIDYNELKNKHLPLDMQFNTTDDLAKLDVIIDQEKAKNAMEFGLSINSKGYNIYVSGDSTEDCKIFSRKMINQNLASEITNQDWCYIYNFKDNETPRIVSFEPGQGLKFKNHIDELVLYIHKELPYIYSEETEQDIKQDTAIRKIGYYIKKLKETYNENAKVTEYLDDLQEDMINNIDNIVEGSSTGYMQKMIGKYGVNLIVNNNQTKKPPIVMANNINYNKLMGEIKYFNIQGSFISNHMNIKPGLIHKANGGYLILNAIDLIQDNQLWKVLKDIIQENEISIRNPNFENLISLIKLKPEVIPLNLKIILIGSQELYYFLQSKDNEFKNLFKICCELTNDIENNRENIILVTHLIKNTIDNEKLQPFSVKAVEKVIESVIRYGGDRNKITTDIEYIMDILKQSNQIAVLKKNSVINPNHVDLALWWKKQRIDSYKDKMMNLIHEDKIIINTKGYKVGQINALAVSTIGECSFGVPIRVTCTTYRGNAGIISAEKEVNQSGSISNKALQIIMGYLGYKFGQDIPLAFTARLCYEQNYTKIDGDSASSAQLYSVISSLSGVAIKQSLAVTGSVNQYGDIQPVSNVTRKTEGFFDICKKRGLTGTQGVVIPKQNLENLTLKKEVMEAIKSNNFNVYTVSSIEEGVELLMKENITTIFDKVQNKLKRFAKSIQS